MGHIIKTSESHSSMPCLHLFCCDKITRDRSLAGLATFGHSVSWQHGQSGCCAASPALTARALPSSQTETPYLLHTHSVLCELTDPEFSLKLPSPCAWLCLTQSPVVQFHGWGVVCTRSPITPKAQSSSTWINHTSHGFCMHLQPGTYSPSPGICRSSG